MTAENIIALVILLILPAFFIGLLQDKDYKK